MNAHQLAVLASLNNILNAQAAVQTACQGFTNLLAHFPAGSLPTTAADVAAVSAAEIPGIAALTKDVAVESEFTSLA